MSDKADLISALSELVSQVRSTTLRMLSKIESGALTWSPHGTKNHILWHAGHVLWVGDVLTVEPITGQSELPVGWEAIFGEGSQPGKQTNWPDALEVTARLESQLHRVLTLFAERGSLIEQRANEMCVNSGWQLLPGILHGWHDESRHQGEMHLLAKLYRSRSR